MYPITLTNCLKYIARVIYGKRKNRDFLHLLLHFFFFFFKRPSTKLGQLQAIKIIQSRLDTGRTWNLIKDNLCKAKRFSHTVRYIDDLLTLNNTMFEGEICNIYPTELTLKKTTECTSRLSYLDISISIYSGRYVTELYDKRDNFNFEIVICVVIYLLDLRMVFMFHSLSGYVEYVTTSTILLQDIDF